MTQEAEAGPGMLIILFLNLLLVTQVYFVCEKLIELHIYTYNLWIFCMLRFSYIFKNTIGSISSICHFSGLFVPTQRFGFTTVSMAIWLDSGYSSDSSPSFSSSKH